VLSVPCSSSRKSGGPRSWPLKTCLLQKRKIGGPLSWPLKTCSGSCCSCCYSVLADIYSVPFSSSSVSSSLELPSSSPSNSQVAPTRCPVTREATRCKKKKDPRRRWCCGCWVNRLVGRRARWRTRGCAWHRDLRHTSSPQRVGVHVVHEQDLHASGRVPVAPGASLQPHGRRRASFVHGLRGHRPATD
jgi:hypothetical protein